LFIDAISKDDTHSNERKFLPSGGKIFIYEIFPLACSFLSNIVIGLSNNLENTGNTVFLFPYESPEDKKQDKRPWI
jgi:hypothetical protein